MNKKLLFWSIVVALGGFLFGMDVAVISGAEQEIQRIWGLSDVLHGQAIAAALYGTVIGALFGGIPSERYGRKNTLIVIGLLYLVSSLGAAFSHDVYSFMAFRFIGGLGVGASSVVAPMYISEIAPAKTRGRFVAVFQFNIVFGILLSYFTNYLIRGTGTEDWRWMLGIVAIPALVFILLMFLVPESPRWLMVHRKQYDKAREILAVSDPEGVDEAILAIQKEVGEEKKKISRASFFSGRFNVQIMLAFFIAFFNQMSGINAIIYFAPRVFEMAGIGKDAAFLQSAGVGLVNLIFTMLGLYLIDRLGRKKLMLVGSAGYIISLAVMAAAFYFKMNGIIVPVFVFLFIASHVVGQGAVIWVFISEIFPNQVRSYGQSLGCSTHWVLAAIVSASFPFFANKFGAGPIFLFFAIMMVLQLIWVMFKMPETKGVPLEELDAKLHKSDKLNQATPI